MRPAQQYLRALLPFTLALLLAGCTPNKPISPETTVSTTAVTEPTLAETACAETKNAEQTIPEPILYYEVSYVAENKLASGSGVIYSYRVLETAGGYRIQLDYSVPEGMDAGAYLWANMEREVLWEREPFTTGQRDTLEFEITAEQAARWEDLNIAFGSEESGYFSVAVQLPFCPMQTDGQPLGAAIIPGYSVNSELKTASYEIYDCQVHKLDNDHLRYTVDFSATSGMSVTVFRSPDSGYRLYHRASTTGQRQQLVFDLPLEDAAAVPEMMICFSVSDHDRFFLQIPTAPVFCQTAGIPSGEVQALSAYEVRRVEGCSIPGGTCQLLDNGYYRYDLSCELPAETRITVLYGVRVMCFASGNSGEGMHIRFDVDAETASSVRQFSLSADTPDGKQYVVTFDTV